MHPFMLVINCIPSDKTKARNVVSKSIAHIWVFAENINDAKDIAENYVMKYGWIPRETQHAFEITNQQLQNLHPAEFELYQKASVYGIAMDMISGMDEQILPDGTHMEIPLDKLID